MVGVRGGVNFADYSVRPDIGDIRFTPGSPRAGYDVASSRLNSRSTSTCNQASFTELITLVNYLCGPKMLNAGKPPDATERFEIPVQLGFQFGVLRLFGGLRTVPRHGLRAQQFPQLLRIGFNNGDVGIMGGLASTSANSSSTSASRLPRSRVWHDFTSDGVSRRVKVPHDIVYGGFVGFFF